MIEIIVYQHKYADDFKRLNLEWLEKFNLVETHDLEILDNPDEIILNPGGCIFLAKSGNEIIGSAALIKEPGNIYELAKMAVTAQFQGKGISKILLEKCIKQAKEWQAEKLILVSNSQLKSALSLYEKYGFQYVPVTGTSFLTADIKMELSLSTN